MKVRYLQCQMVYRHRLSVPLCDILKSIIILNLLDYF